MHTCIFLLTSVSELLWMPGKMFSIFKLINIYSVLASIILFLWYYSRSAHSYWRKLNIKYLEPVPFLGNAAKMMFGMAPITEEHDKCYKALHNEPFGGLYRFLQPVFFVKDPDLVTAILVKDFNHFHDHGFKLMFNQNKKLDPLTTHLFFTEGERWRVLRQKMSPVFTSGKLKEMLGQILDCTDLLIKMIDERMGESDSVDVGLKKLFEKLTIDVIGSCAFGIDCNSLKSNEEFSYMCKDVSNLRGIVLARIILATFSQRLANLMKITFLRKEVNDFFLNLTLDTIKHRRQSGMTRSDILQLLMHLQNSHSDPKFAVQDEKVKVLANEEFDELDIAANAFLFFAAGFETTATTLSFCFYELALNELIQEKLRSEVRQVKDECQKLTYEMLKRMTYMDAVISETLRKYPPTVFINRECTKDYLLPGTNTYLPAGIDVIIPVWSIHHDCEHYPNPEAFDPERFIGDHKQSRPGIFLPFGDGPRYCLGKRFADMEIKAALAEIILRYDLKPCGKTKIPLKFDKAIGALKTTCGTWIKLVKRKN